MGEKVIAQAEVFARSYAAMFSSPAASSSERVADLAKEIGTYYRPGMTMYTKGQISRFDVGYIPPTSISISVLISLQSQEQAGRLIENEMRNNIASGLGTKLVLEKIEKIEPYSETCALCWLNWSFHPQVGSEFEGKGWDFTNIYGYRAESDGKKEGWELVVRDQEVNEIKRVTGKSFES